MPEFPVPGISDLARLIIHEAIHPLAYLQGWNSGYHGRIDGYSRDILDRYGLDGGGCYSLSYWLPLGGFLSC